MARYGYGDKKVGCGFICCAPMFSKDPGEGFSIAWP